MSKVVKKVGRAVGKVFKGVKKLVSSAWKKVKSSKLLKTIAIAGAVFVTGGAALGAIGGATAGWGASAAAGGGFLGNLGAAVSGGLSGALSGAATAWTGLSQAAGQALGGDFGGAFNSMKGVYSGPQSAFSAGRGSIAGAMNSAGTGEAATNVVGSPQSTGADPFAASQMEAVAAPGETVLRAGESTATNLASDGNMFSRMMGSPYTMPALINTGGQVAQGWAAGKSEEERLDRMNRNIGTPIDFSLNPAYGR